MAVLDFGIKRIVKQRLIEFIVWDAVIFIILFFKMNSLTDLLDEKVTVLIPFVLFLFQLLLILFICVFDKSFIRVEVKDSKLMLTSLQFLNLKTKEYKMEEGMTYMITRKNGFRSTFRRFVRVYIKGVEVYVIKESDLNEEEIEQVISFFRVHVPENLKREEKW